MAAGAAKRIGKLLWHRATPRRVKVKMIMTFIYPTVAYGCETWAIAEKEKQRLNTWWMKIMRRAMGVTRRDKVRSDVILQELKASKLSDLVKERQLRYCGHVERYPEERWVKFAVRATLPGQKKSGRKKQYCKSISKLLKEYTLTTEMMKDAKNNEGGWRTRLSEIFPKNNEKKLQIPISAGADEKDK